MEFTFSTQLRASADEVWRVVGTMEGVNAELGPWVRMTAPAAAKGLHLERATVGEVLFVSWLCVLGVPVDRHSLKLERVLERGFFERSSSWMQREWVHEREVVPVGEGCRVTDRVVSTPRVRWLGGVVGWVVRVLFRHRHRRLRARFGARG